MINSYGHTVSSTWSVFQGLKYVFVAVAVLWVLSELAPFVKGTRHDLSIYGEYSSIQFPDQKLLLSDYTGRSMEVKTLWNFNVKGEGGQGIKKAVFEVPFRGFYRTAAGGKESDLSFFDRKISLGDLGPYQELTVKVWSESEPNPELEGYTRIVHADGSIPVDYPVKVTGFMAWVSREKALIAVAFMILALIFTV